MRIIRPPRRLFAVAAVLLFSIPASSLAVTRYVWTNSPSPTAPYTNWNTAAHEIQPAINACAAGDLVRVTNGVYDKGAYPTPGSVASNRVLITNGVRVASVNGPDVTSIVGQPDPSTLSHGPGAVRCAYVQKGILAGFTLTNGFTHVIPNDVRDQNGGGVCIDNGTVTNCIIRNCSAEFAGGGVQFIFGTGVAHTCIITENSANRGGGAFFNTFNSTLQNSVVVSNSANTGGGLSIVGNVIIDHCTIVNNNAVVGGGVHSSLACLVRNSIVYFNTAFVDTNYSAVVLFTNSCTTPLPTGIGNIGADPQLSGYHLRAGSPCIDAATNIFGFPFNSDIDGQPRVFRGERDMGADEAVVEGTVIFPAGGFISMKWIAPLGTEALLQNNATLPSTNWIAVGNVMTAASLPEFNTVVLPLSENSRAYRLIWVGP